MQHIRLKSFSFTFSGVHLNLVKVSVLYELWHNTFHQVLFDMSENEDVISQPVIMKKIIDANDCKTMQIILQNFLPSPKLKSTSICYGELRREKWASNISINCFNYNIFETTEKTVFHVDNYFRIILPLCASIMKIFINISRIALTSLFTEMNVQ